MNNDQMITRIELLLMAADFIERRGTDLSDHGYASTQTMHRGIIGGGSAAGRQRRRTTSRSSTSSLSSSWNRGGGGGVRSMHNEMEKTRRANLRHCLERLKNAMPTNELAKNTTLQLLKRAKVYIAKLEHEQSLYEKTQNDLMRQHAELNRALTQITATDGKVASATEAIDAGSSSSRDGVGPARYRLRSVGSASSEAESPTSRPSSATGAFFSYRLRVDSYSPSASSPSGPESASDISDDIDIMGTGSDSDEYGQ